MPQDEGGSGAGSESDETDREAPLERSGSGGLPVYEGIEGAADDAFDWNTWTAAPARALRASARRELEEELGAGLASGLSAREHMLDLIRLTRDGSLPPLDPDICRVLALMLAELSGWVAEYDPGREGDH